MTYAHLESIYLVLGQVRTKMALGYDLYLSGLLIPDNVPQVLAEAIKIPDKIDSRGRPPALIGCAKPLPLTRAMIQQVFNFEPTVNLWFRINKFEPLYLVGMELMMRHAAFYLK